MPMVTVRYWAAAKHAAGVAEETISAGTLSEVLATVAARPRETGPARGAPGQAAPSLAAVLERSSVLIDGEPVGSRAPDAVVLADAAVIEVLPPFAGG